MVENGELATPLVDKGAFIADGAVVVGDVHIGPESSIWFQSVVRGDSAPIRIGKAVNIQDGSILHVDEGCPLTLHDGVTVGHLCIVHGCEIGAGSLVGMGSIVMNGVKVGEDSLIGAGSLLTEGKEFPPKSLIIGRPARVVRELTEADIRGLRRATTHYVDAGALYKRSGHHQEME